MVMRPGWKRRLRENAPRIFDIEEPMTLPSAREERFWRMHAMMTASSIDQLNSTPVCCTKAHLFPFCTCCEQGYQCLRNFKSTRNNRCVVDETISTEFEEKETSCKCAGIEADSNSCLEFTCFSKYLRVLSGRTKWPLSQIVAFKHFTLPET